MAASLFLNKENLDKFQGCIKNFWNIREFWSHTFFNNHTFVFKTIWSPLE